MKHRTISYVWDSKLRFNILQKFLILKQNVIMYNRPIIQSNARRSEWRACYLILSCKYLIYSYGLVNLYLDKIVSNSSIDGGTGITCGLWLSRTTWWLCLNTFSIYEISSGVNFFSAWIKWVHTAKEAISSGERKIWIFLLKSKVLGFTPREFFLDLELTAMIIKLSKPQNQKPASHTPAQYNPIMLHSLSLSYILQKLRNFINKSLSFLIHI